MIKRNTIGILLCVLVGIQAHAQSYFNLLDTVASGYSKLVYDQDHYFATGAVFNPSGSGSVMLSKYTLDGVHVLSDTFTTDGIASMNGRFVEVAGDLYLFNIINEIYPYEYVNNDLQLHKMDKSFNLSFSTLLGGNNSEVGTAILALNNELYLLAATHSFGAGLGDFYLIKKDLDGNVIWENTYGSAQNDFPFSIAPTQDGNLLLSGHKEINSPDWNIYMVLVDTAGNMLWEKDYGGSLNDYYGGSSTSFDHSFLVYRNCHNTTLNTRSGFVEKLDGNGDLIWSKEFAQNDYSVFDFSVPKENDDGTIIVVNHALNANGKMIVKLHKLDPIGNILWTKEYYTRPDASQYINDIKPTVDGGYVMCGGAFPVDSNVQRAWLIKTNCNGEEGVQHPITAAPCDQYDCTLYPVDANFTPSATYVDLGIESGLVTFENNSANATSRVWHFGDGTTDYTDSIISYTYTQPGIYEVELIIYHGMCSDTVTHTVEVVNTAGMLSPNLDYGVSVYPNPSNGSFVLSFKHAPEGNFEIIDLAGRIHYGEELNGALSYSINDLHAGAYLLRIYYPSGVSETKRVIVE